MFKAILLSSLFLGLTVVSQVSQARQYTQCDATNAVLYSVINLTNQSEGTLFLTLGTETDTHSLSKLSYVETKNNQMIYRVYDGPFEGTLLVPADIIGTTSDFVQATLLEGNRGYDFSCFTRFYQD